VLVVVGVVVVVVDEGVVVVVVGVVVIVDPEGVVEVAGGGDDVLPELVLVVGVPELEDVDVVVVPPDADDELEVEVEFVDEPGFVELEEVASRPLLCSRVSISCCTAATAEGTAAGVALGPSSASALGCLRSAASCAASSLEGCDLSVTTI
jgi:hypothetical protein